ncbi:MAG TPA: hypothetical protein VKW08_18510 [Xanthobacteraceae bacterium]|nr:hypothetical protein [Xanthobacteraceae bacterium]
MRILELSVVIGVLAYIIRLLSPSPGIFSWLNFIPLLCLPVLGLHLILEGYRWQMAPAYLLVFMSAMYAFAPQLKDVQLQYFAGLLALGVLGVAIVLSTVFPVFQLPGPTGPYSVGTQIRRLVDTHRREPADPGSNRELMVQIWYPAEPSARGKQAFYRERASTTASDARFALVETHSIVDAPIVAVPTRLPLLLYTPSWDGMRTENTVHAEDLASHGYIVVGIDHPYSSLATVFPDGRVIRTKLVDEDFFSSEAAYAEFLHTAEAEIRLRADDARFVLDELEKLDADDPKGLLGGRVDLARAGIFGFSLGAGAAAQACWLDRRFKACVNLDGMMAGESSRQGAVAPFFIISEPEPPAPESFPNGKQAELREMAFEREQYLQMRKLMSAYGGSWLTITGSEHFNFSDYAFSSPLRRFSNSGPVGAENASRLVGRYMLAFFNLHLMDLDDRVLDPQSPHAPEARLEDWKPRTDERRFHSG